MHYEDEHIYLIPDFEAEKRRAIKTLYSVSGVCLLFMTTEIVGGFFANSLAILTDAAHLFSDAIGFFISIFSLYLSQMAPNHGMSYGYQRAEVIGSLMSVTIIQLLTLWLVFEAVHRVLHPSPINASLMLLVSILGLIFNLSMMKILDNPPG